MEESQEDQAVVDYFSRPHSTKRQEFFKFHPQQNATNPVIQRLFTRTDDMAWKWLTYSDERNALFCFLCLAFSKPNDPSSFIGGMTDWRHVHQRIEEHERGMAHRQCAEAYVQCPPKVLEQ